MGKSQRERDFLEQAREKLAHGGGHTRINYTDAHHVAHDRAIWEARSESKYIRGLLIADGLWRATHNLLHSMCPAVPIPNYQTLQYVANRMHPDGDIFKRIDRYCELVDERTSHPKMKPIEKDVCHLSIEAMRMQLPFLREGLENDKRRIIT